MPGVAAMVCIAATSLQLSAADVGAQTFNTTFSGLNFTCLNSTDPTFCAGSSNNRPAAVIRSSGDFWNQTITGSGIGTVSSLSLLLTMSDNLVGNNAMQFSVLLNGMAVGTTPMYGPIVNSDLVAPLTFSFAGISASTYDVKVRVSSSNVGSNQQGLALVLDGSSTISLSGVQTVAPEPGTYALMLAGLAGLGVVARRRHTHS